MTTYTAIPDTEIADDKPILTSTGRQLRDNPLAIAEGDSTAPAVLSKAVTPHFRYQTVASSGEAEFSGFSGWGGCYVEFKTVDYGGGDTVEITIDFSDDGVTYYGEVVLLLLPGGGGADAITFNVNCSFEDEDVRWGYSFADLSTLGTGTGTSTGTTYASTTYVRIRRSFASGASSGVQAGPIFAKLERWREMT